MAGVFNGLSNYTPSHRARLPSIHNVFVAAAAPGRAELLEQALHVRDGIWVNRTTVRTASCRAVVEQRMYCHRTRRNVMVLELEALPPAAAPVAGGQSGGAPPACSAVAVVLRHREELTADGTIDVRFTDLQLLGRGEAEGAVTAVSGETRLPELYSAAPTALALAYDTVPRSLTLVVVMTRPRWAAPCRRSCHASWPLILEAWKGR